MSCELLLSIKLEVTVLAVVNGYLVVHALPCEVLSIGMHSGIGYRLSVGVAQVLRDDRDTELPLIELLIISSRDKTTTIFNEGYRVN